MRRRIYKHHPTILSALALVVALTTSGAYAANHLITSKQIQNGAIKSPDIHKNAVKTSDIGTDAVGSADIKTAAVQSADIGEGQVGPQDVTMPEGHQCIQGGESSATVNSADFALVDSVCQMGKTDPTSQLEVTWTGTAAATEINCVFQVRVDGAAAANGAGTTYVGAVGPNSTTSVSVSALFSGLPAGPHTIEVWARLTHGSPAACIVGPGGAGIPQTFVAHELVI